MPKAHKLYRFADYTLNATRRTLFQNDVEIRLKDRAFDVLVFLIEDAPSPRSFDEIIKGVWDETHVLNNSVEKIITELRSALEDDKNDPRFIRTYRGRGYSFICDVQEIEPETSFSGYSNAVRTRSKFKSFFPYLIVAIVLFSGLSLWKGRQLFASRTSKPIFEDDFSGPDIDATRWAIDGKTVRIENGVVKLDVEETDNWGRLKSSYFAFDPNKPITIKSRIKVTYSQNLKDKAYFHGYFALSPKTSVVNDEIIKNQLSFGVKYANYDYESKYSDGNIDEQKAEGFYLVKAGSDPTKRVDYETGKISPRIRPVWDEWFEQTMVYDPTSGDMTFSINDELKQKFNVGRFSTDLPENKLRLEINPEGWWLYHSIEIDYIQVTQ